MKRRGFLGSMLGLLGSAAVVAPAEAKVIESALVTMHAKCSNHCGRLVPVTTETPTMVVCDLCSKGKFLIDTEQWKRECGVLDVSLTGDSLNRKPPTPTQRVVIEPPKQKWTFKKTVPADSWDHTEGYWEREEND